MVSMILLIREVQRVSKYEVEEVGVLHAVQ